MGSEMCIRDRHNSRVHSAAGKLGVAGNGRGVIVGCLEQYQQRWGFVRLATSRAAWPHALTICSSNSSSGRSHGGSRSGNFVSWSFFYRPATSRGGGDRSGLHGGVLVGMNDEFVFTMDTPVDVCG